jgi:hypothetical protein
MNDKDVMKIISKVAEAVPPFAQARVAAALVYKNEIISIGTNKNKTHPFQKKYAVNDDAIYLHAETDAIYNGLRKHSTDIISKSKLYISRMKYPDGSKKFFVPGLSKPCEGCARAIATFNIKHVCYTIDSGGFDFL